MSIDRDGGDKMAIGAAEMGDEFTLTHKNNGNIYLMNLTASSTWQLQSSLIGVGSSFFSTSSFFHRLAVRHNQPNFVQVFDISDLSSPKSISGPIFGTAHGRMVTMSADGNHVAVSSETYKQNTGMVEFFGLASNGQWVSEGSLGGSEPLGLFGWSTAFSNNANRIVISSLGSETVRVYEKSELFGWTKVGQTLSTVLPGDRFGFAVDMAASAGNTIAVSSPGSQNASSREDESVRVFDLVEGKWQIRGEALNLLSNDGVKLSNQGSRVVVSTKSQGVVIFDWDQSKWIRYDNAKFGGLGVAINRDASRIAGATLIDARIGAVDVYDTSVNPPPSGQDSMDPLTVIFNTEPPTDAPTALGGLQICECNSQLMCLENHLQIKENELFICFKSLSADRRVLDIQELSFIQGSRKVTRILNSTKDKLTWVTKLNLTTTVRTRFDPSFFQRSIRGRRHVTMNVEGILVFGSQGVVETQLVPFGLDISLQGTQIIPAIRDEKELLIIVFFSAFVVMITVLIWSSVWRLVSICCEVASLMFMTKSFAEDKHREDDSTHSEEDSNSVLSLSNGVSTDDNKYSV